MIPKLSVATIRHHTITQSFDRGQDYYRNGAVTSLIQRGNVLSANVEGSEADPYRIIIRFDQGGITSANCTCLYAYEGWCKHIVACLLTCLHQPDHIEQRSELAELLAPLSREQLQGILQDFSNEQPDWADAIEQKIIQLTQSKATELKASRQTIVDPKPIEQQVERIIDRYSGQWNDAPALDEIRTIIQKAYKFIEQGDGNNALIILGAIIHAYIQTWMNLDGSSGESGALFEDLDDALTEAILSAELSASDRSKWRKSLETWCKEVDDYGVDSFGMSLAALEQGWEHPLLRSILQGEMVELSAWKEETSDFAGDLAIIRLKILERRGRYQEYLDAEFQGD